MTVEALIFDADDTLWSEQEQLLDFECRIEALLQEFHTSPGQYRQRFLEVEEKNIPVIGYGFASYTFSFAETIAMYESDNQLRHSLLTEFRSLYDHLAYQPPQVFEEVRETLIALRERGYRLFVLTRGIPSEQRHKLEASGLRELFDGVMIVQRKSREVFAQFCTQNQLTPARTVMIGNSIKSDVLPALDAGCGAVWVPPPVQWSHDHAEEYQSREFKKIERFRQLLSIFLHP